MNNKTNLIMKKYKVVLKAKFIESKKNLFYYSIIGKPEWVKKFINQKNEYVKELSSGLTVYSVPWYFGKDCDICVNDFNEKLFFDINEHEMAASILERLNQDYWHILSDKTRDVNWRSKSKKGNSK